VWAEGNQSLVFIVGEEGSQWVGKQALDNGEIQPLFQPEGTGSVWRVLPKNNGFYYMLAHAPLNDKPTTKLKHYDKQTNTHTDVLLSSREFTPYRVAMSPDQNSIAIAGESAENKVEFRLFDLPSQTLSTPFATLPLGFTEINWHPNGDALLVHHLNELYTLSLEGVFDKLPYNNYQRVFNPVYHPDGRKVLMTITENDTDISMFNTQTSQLEVSIDSSAEDHLARYSPDGQSIAFVSSRSGKQQLYIAQNGKVLSVFSNPDNLPIYRAPVWSKLGDSLAFAFANNLYIYHIQTKVLNILDMPSTFTAILDRYHNDDHLLMVTKQGNVSYFSKYDLSGQTTTNLAKTGVHYSARLNAQDELVFYKNGVLHWGASKFTLEKWPQISGNIYPVEDNVIFQSGRKIILFDGQSHTVLVSELPESVISLADVLNKNEFILQSSATPKAQIVALE
jgi:hypothetical protein